MSRAHAAAHVASWALGLAWLVVALAKAPELWDGVPPGTWASRWGTPVLAGVTLAELVIAWWLLTGRTVRGGAWALGLLAAIAIASYLRPPGPDQPCGCLGALKWLEVMERLHPAIKAAGLASVHLLLLACVTPMTLRAAPAPSPLSFSTPRRTC